MEFRDNWNNRPPKTFYDGEFKLITEQSHVPTSTLVETMVRTGKYYADHRTSIYDEANMNLDPNRIPNADLTDFQNAAETLIKKRDELNDANSKSNAADSGTVDAADKVESNESTEKV